jgi:hypothetical protein
MMSMNDEVFISTGNSKLGMIPNVSLPPVLACGSDCGCRSKLCYALRIYKRHAVVRKRWDSNLTIAITDPHQYFYSIHKQLQGMQPEYFRWHVGGDILNQQYLESMKTVAADHPKTKFLCFTKMYNLQYVPLPKNLRIVFSAWPGHLLVRWKPDRLLPVAWMQDGTEDRIPSDAKECTGSCHDCHACWDLKRGEHVYFHLH